MKFYTKIINEKTKEVLLINQIEAKKQGLQEMEVEFGYDGKAYLKGYIPEKTLEELKQEKILELKNSRKIYKQSVFINGLDLETICNKQNLKDNIILSIHPFNEKDTEIFKNEIRFISEFYDEKEKKINNAKSQTTLKNINVVFKKEEKKE